MAQTFRQTKVPPHEVGIKPGSLAGMLNKHPQNRFRAKCRIKTMYFVEKETRKTVQNTKNTKQHRINSEEHTEIAL